MYFISGLFGSGRQTQLMTEGLVMYKGRSSQSDGDGLLREFQESCDQLKKEKVNKISYNNQI